MVEEGLGVALAGLALVAGAVAFAFQLGRRTRIRQLRQALRNQAKYTNDVLDSTPVAISLRDAAGKHLFVNRQWEEWFGNDDRTIGSTVRERLPPAKADEVMRLDREAFEAGPGAAPGMADVQIAGRRYTQTRSVVSDDEGKVAGLLVASIDITERHDQEQKLRDQMALTKAVIDENPNAISVKDKDGRYVTVNDAWVRMIGLQREHVLGRNIRELFQSEEAERHHASDMRLIEKRRGWTELETLRTGPDGKPQWLMVRKAVLRDGEGMVIGIIGTNTDITALKRSQEELAQSRAQIEHQKTILQTTLENIDQGITMIDREMRIMAFNRRFLELLEFPDDLFKRRPALENVFRYNAERGEYGPGDPDEQVRTRMELARRFEPHYFERKRPNGTVLAIRGQPLLGGAGFVTTYTDITEQKRAEEDLRASVALREEVERMSRHDLKTPINSVIAVSRMLRENTRLSPDDAQLLATVERAGYRILDMVNLSLDLFRMEQGTYEFRPQAVDLGEVAAKVATDLQGQAASKNVFVRVQARALATAWAEELLCYSILANLVKNAIEAAPEGTEVSIALEREGDGSYVRVHNEGAVPEEVRGRFFQKYATAGKRAGMGFGTYSAHLLARVQGGEVTLHTSEAEGTTITVRLKAAEAEASRGARHEAGPKATAPGARAALPELKVLVADDDEFNRLVLKHHLPSPPLKVTMAVNGRAAVDQALEEWPDVLLLDLEMPVMDGYEAAAKLREIERERHRKRILIVAISSNDEDAIIRRALAAGCDQYLVKPASREILWQILAGATVPLASGGAGPADAQASDDVTLDPDLERTLHDFLASRREALDEMPRALQAGDRATFKRLAHRLAGSFALYGFRWAASESKAIEREAADGDAAALATRTAALREHLDAVKVRVARKDAVTP